MIALKQEAAELAVLENAVALLREVRDMSLEGLPPKMLVQIIKAADEAMKVAAGARFKSERDLGLVLREIKVGGAQP